ncbi:50S ribosomal protein L6 [Candidatus Poriferisodalis sp.]|uniref:50S ribosomal protein L6 n=1 Tax=Candidatus Poriferisodalis sp. TaxID=3101277 RepID=UPI003B01A637
MSRVGKAPISIPDGVTVTAESAADAAGSPVGAVVTVSGPQGELTRELAAGITVHVYDGVAALDRADDSRSQRSLHGLSRALVANMVEGVSAGFSKELQIVGVGYRAAARGPSALELSLGFSHTVPVTAPEGISFEVPSQTSIIVKGIDKQLVGQVAANIRKLRKPEPYKGKGIRYVNERVLRKAGKAAK